MKACIKETEFILIAVIAASSWAVVVSMVKDNLPNKTGWVFNRLSVSLAHIISIIVCSVRPACCLHQDLFVASKMYTILKVLLLIGSVALGSAEVSLYIFSLLYNAIFQNGSLMLMIID